ncbi:hypothetical protein JX265_008923 [Neoarthrinium moseri]|uniref:Carboxylesterase type B domain-containing protein n=1 Tax=Neoarthrinium moseri TaxID=1658444 RepID=A0A9P9WH14_9PEZI|nr:uncharacterized protein JN550_007792 [Neoarthrinium moseri]KAI1862877.1 hypothetical protein JX265_008923 [Neoarthrinium moseri]KAI1866103.1 hypothetical protein JN550_007792 [Neoarthrinium moseri]
MLPLVSAQLLAVTDKKGNLTYIGASDFGVEQFQNIFYGQDTSGANRFAPPIPFECAAGSVIDATQSGAWCPQGTGPILPFTSVIANISENCLSLRIARPYGTQPNAKLPVMIWVHGGGYALGSGSDILYEPGGIVAQAAADKRPLIWVDINYRLNWM